MGQPCGWDRAARRRRSDELAQDTLVRVWERWGDVAGTADLLGCAPGTVKATTHHAMTNLRSSGLVQHATGEGQRA